MCGRFTLSTAADVLQQLFEIDAGPMPALAPRYNVAPSQDVAVVRAATAAGRREMVLLRWGLVPSWAKDADIGNRLINARSETVADKPAFRSAFVARRCLLPADGFYEWASTDGGKQPYLFRMRTAEPFALAGLWETWRPTDGPRLDTCTILTTAANGVVAPVHPRMPVILPADAYGAWLDPDNRSREALQALLRPADDGLLVGFRVDRRVGSPRHDDPGLVKPLD